MRFGMIHRNTYVNAPVDAGADLRDAHAGPGLFFAGQMSGVEGYVESAASGLLAGIGAAFRARGRGAASRSPRTPRWARSAGTSPAAIPRHYQPTNIAFGLLPELPQRVRDKARRRLALARAGPRAAWSASGPARGAPEPAPRAAARRRAEARRAGGDRRLPAPPGARAQRLRPTPCAPTARTSRSSLAHLREELGREPRPADVDHLLIRAFLARLHRRGLKKVSAARKLASLRTFFRYLCREGILERNPARALLSPRLERRIPAHLDEARGRARCSTCPARRRRRRARAGHPGAALRDRDPLRRAGGPRLCARSTWTRDGPGAG